MMPHYLETVSFLARDLTFLATAALSHVWTVNALSNHDRYPEYNVVILVLTICVGTHIGWPTTYWRSKLCQK
jgi:hypothetical protein